MLFHSITKTGADFQPSPVFVWRRERDLNPRYPCEVHTISRSGKRKSSPISLCENYIFDKTSPNVFEQVSRLHHQAALIAPASGALFQAAFVLFDTLFHGLRFFQLLFEQNSLPLLRYSQRVRLAIHLTRHKSYRYFANQAHIDRYTSVKQFAVLFGRIALKVFDLCPYKPSVAITSSRIQYFSFLFTSHKLYTKNV